MTHNNPTVFIVDDEPLLSEMLADYLKEQDNGFNIQSFPTGEACLQSLHLLPNIVILKEIKKRNKTLPVIMLSSQKSYATATKTIMYGAVHYVIKGQDAFEEIYQLIKANI